MFGGVAADLTLLKDVQLLDMLPCMFLGIQYTLCVTASMCTICV